MLERELRRHVEDFQRYGHGFAVLFIDIDHFKTINDRFGHHAGDEVLAMTARTLAGCVRVGDTVGRWGGEEFVVVAPVDGAPVGTALAERIRSLVAAGWTRVGGHRVGVTVSIGVAVAAPGEAAGEVGERADLAMLAAKSSGRNAVRQG